MTIFLPNMIDLIRITRQSDLYNFHSHTQFCDGKANMQDFVEAAIEQHFTDYGFSPHSPIPVASSCNITQENVPKYIDEYHRLKSLYGSKINLYLSFEIDYINENWGPSSAYFDTLPLDYRIGSVHFIPYGDTFVDVDGSFSRFKLNIEKYFDNDIRTVVDSFFSQSLKMIEQKGFDIIGHFDKIAHNANMFQPGIETEPWFAKHIQTMLEAIADSRLIVEINTKSYANFNRFFPNRQYFHKIKKMGIPVVINSDAHRPDKINSSRFEAMEAFKNS